MVETIQTRRVLLTIIKRANAENQQLKAGTFIFQLQLVIFSSLVFLLVLIFSPLPGNAGMNVLPVNPDGQKFQLGPYIQILEDTSKDLDITDVSSPRFSDKFLANQSLSINHGITESPFWFRFSLAASEKNHTYKEIGRKSGSTEWLLYLGKQLDFYDEIKIFWKGAGEAGVNG